MLIIVKKTIKSNIQMCFKIRYITKMKLISYLRTIITTSYVTIKKFSPFSSHVCL